MKKYICDRCGVSLTNKDGSAAPHYNMKDRANKHIRHKNEQFVCVPCVRNKEEAKEKAKEANG